MNDDIPASICDLLEQLDDVSLCFFGKSTSVVLQSSIYNPTPISSPSPPLEERAVERRLL
jgi:hypothetical protein